MDEKELQECINGINKELDEEEQKKQFVVDVYNEKDCSELVNVSNDGKTITLFEDPSIEIVDESLKEKILSQLYFQENNISRTTFQSNSKKICDNLQQDSDFDFGEEQQSQLDRKKVFAALKVSARESGYKILNSLDECDSGENIDLKAIEVEKGKKITFQDLKSAYENFTIDYRDDSWTDLYVKDRKTGEEITDPELEKIAKFASVWVGSVGTKWMANEELKGITYAFNEPSERLYTQLGTLVEKCMKDNGMIDTKAIYEELAKDSYKHSEEAIRNLLSNQSSMKILYDFYKIQVNDAKMETRLADTSNKFLFGFAPEHLVESEVEDTLNGIEQFNRGKGTIAQGLQQEMSGKVKKQEEHAQEVSPTIHGDAAKSFGRNTQPATSEVNKTTSAMADRINIQSLETEQKKLMISCNNHPEMLSQDKQKRLNEIAHQIALYNAQISNQQDGINEGKQKKNNGMGMGR